MTKDELREKANELPLSPGVYLMLDKSGTVIYVGKAKKLKNRVSQYFREDASHALKTRLMVEQVREFDTILVSSEFEALVLENSLIKRHQPRYNILLKDDKGYPFVRLGGGEYPRFTLVNRVAADGARYFGPFGGRHDTRLALDAVANALKLPTCRREFPRDIGKERPCLNFHMGRCDGFCRPCMTAEEYRRRMEQAVLLLEGKLRQVTKPLEEEMARESEALHFERCAALRDTIAAIEVLGNRQKVIAGVCADTHIWGLYRGDVKWACAVLYIKDGALTGKETRVFDVPVEETAEAVLGTLLNQYYLTRGALPKEILLPLAPEELESLAAAFTEKAGRRVYVRTPLRGEKAELLAMAERNAREEAEHATGEAERRSRTLELLGKYMGLTEAPRRLESYDISNTGGDDIVASMVVSEDGKFVKGEYRKFRIKSVSGAPDDYASMHEALSRRFQRYLQGDEKFSRLPDALLIDGGETHAAVAEAVLRETGLVIPVFGMVKDDRHRTRALITAEGREIGISGNEAVFSFVGRIQEETHRFAVTFHHKVHGKRAVASRLDAIPGIGKTRKAALLRRFGSVKAVAAASREELQAVLPRPAAEAVYESFHGEAK
ncbi:MAG: excinuclease ABC subunit UvrC [Oscillospiraceae bacterium]